MAVLRNVPKTFSFEEQRIEINEIAQDLYDLNVTASAISLTDISVVKPNPTASGSGDVTYDSSNGQFTYTPPELNFLTDLGDAIVDGDFTTAGLMKTDGAGNYSVITDDSSDWNEAHGWGDHSTAGYLTGLPAHSHSLVGLSDTSLLGGDAPSDGEALVWDQNNTTWKAGTISSGWQGNVQNSTTANGRGAISFDVNTNTLIFQPTEFNYDGTGVAQGKTLRYNGTKWVISEDVSYSQAILGDFSSVQWDLTPTIDGGAGVADSITITAGDNITFSSVTGSGFTIDAEDAVVNINDLGDVDTTGAVNGKILKHNGTQFVIADDASGSTITALNDIGDVNVGTTITDGHVLKWDLATTKWIAGPDLTSSGGSGIALTDISVVKPNPTAAGSGDVTYNSTSGQFTYTPPSIPAAPVKSDWDSTTGLSEILNKPTIVENLNDLGDVDTTGAANGKILKHNGTSWVVGTDNDSGGGGGSTSPGGADTQLQFNSTGSFAGDASLKWDNTNNRLSIGEDATDSYLEIGNGAPGNSSTRFSIRSNNSSNYLYSYATNMFHISVANASGGGTIQFDSISSTMAQFVRGAECSLYHSGTKRIETTSDGIKISGGIQDKDGELGTAGQILSSTGTELNWIPAPSGGGSGEANVQADWNESSSSSDAYIQNKPTLFSGSYTDLTNQPTIPTNNDQLTNGAGYTTFDGAYGSLTGTPTIPAAQIQTDWTQSNSSSLDFIKNKPTNVSAFTNDAGYITSSSVPSGVPSGTIVMYNGSSAPTGWVICNGSNSTPDLRDKFILAAGSTYSVGDTGGSADAVVVSHSHGAGNFGTNNTGSHTHGQGNLSTSNTGGHAHASGNLSTNNTGSHSHTQSGSGSGSTGNQSHNHYHTTSANVTIGGGSHSHNITTAPGDDHNDSIRKTQSGRADSSYYATSTEASSHTHNFNFTQDTLGVSQNHTHDFNFNIGGNTGSDGSHSHNVSGNTATNGDHSHNVSGNTGTNGDHSHTISGNSSSQGSSGSGANLPPYYTLTFIMKT